MEKPKESYIDSRIRLVKHPDFKKACQIIKMASTCFEGEDRVITQGHSVFTLKTFPISLEIIDLIQSMNKYDWEDFAIDYLH